MAKPLFFAGNHSRDHSKLGDLQQQTGLTGILDHLVTEELSETLGRADGGRLLTLVLGQRLGHRLVLRDLKQPEQNIQRERLIRFGFHIEHKCSSLFSILTFKFRA